MSNDLILICSHQNADFDSVASACMAKKLYPGAVCVSIDEPQATVREFLSLHPGLLDLVPYQDLDWSQLRQLVVVDTCSPERLGRLRSVLHRRDIEIHIYDHHLPDSESVQADFSRQQLMGAAVTVVLGRLVEQFGELPILSVEEATLCLIAIYEETGAFRYPSTQPEDLLMAGRLLQMGGNLSMVQRFHSQPLTPEQLAVMDAMIDGGQRVEVYGQSAWVAVHDAQSHFGSLSEIVSRIQELLGVAVVLVGLIHLQEEAASVHWVARSSEPVFDVAHMLRQVGGGGHACAAAARQNWPASEPADLNQSVLEEGIRLTSQLLRRSSQRRPATAGQLLTASCERLDWESSLTVLTTYLHLRERAQRAAVIFKDGQPWGLITRADLSKALHHGLGDSHIKRFCTHPLPKVSPEAGLDVVQQLMVEQELEWVAVVDSDSQLLGWVSRAGLLDHLYHQVHQRSEREALDSGLLDRLPDEVASRLRELGRLADSRGERAYLVGGVVRDLLLERRSFEDFDCVIEGDGLVLSGIFAQHHPVTLRQHEKFGTSTLIWEDGSLSLDIATARRETYCRPAALPAVEDSYMKEDLFRRDFSINAMAVALNPSVWGVLVDPFGGRRDLADGRIRVLHNHSFFDDPTRILRGVRFEQRLQFSLGESTLHQLEQALAEGILQRLSPERVRHELLASTQESQALPIFWRLGQLGVFPLDWPSLVKLPLQREELWFSLHDNWLELKLDTSWDRCLWGCWLELLQPGWHATLAEGNRLGDQVVNVVYRLSGTRLSPSQRFHILRPLNDGQLLWLWALAPWQKSGGERALESIRHFLTRQRGEKNFLKGDDLKNLGLQPGPRFKEILDRAFDAQLDQFWSTRDQALQWLRSEMCTTGSME